MDEKRQRVIGMAAEAAMSEDPFSWFEEIYTSADGDWEMVPWEDNIPNPLFSDWLDCETANLLDSGKALVIGCGLGDDAAFLAKRGWEVTSFDISKTAVNWAQKIHFDLPINWVVADLLEPPKDWLGFFDLVVEIHILQAMPQSLRDQGAEILSTLVGNSGHLVCIGRICEPEDENIGPPWPLTRAAIDSIGANMTQIEFIETKQPTDEEETRRYRAIWQKK